MLHVSDSLPCPPSQAGLVPHDSLGSGGSGGESWEKVTHRARLDAKETGKKWHKTLQEEDQWLSVNKESWRGLEVLGSATFIWSAGPEAQQERQGKTAGELASRKLHLAPRLK